MRKIKIIILAVLICLSAFLPLFSDSREENIDLYLVLDKSLSMVKEIEAVKSYVKDFLVDSFIISGDFLTVINFYGSAEPFITQLVDTESAKHIISAELDKIKADGSYTDIGNALDVLYQTVMEQPSTDRKKYLLLITDGIQEARPESRYYSPDGKFNHFLLENTKTIQKAGWKIQIIGIGSASAAREIAQELSAAYSEVASDGLNSQSLIEATRQITGMIEPVSQPVFSRLNRQGRSLMKITLKSSGYDQAVSVGLEGIYFRDGEHEKWDLIKGVENDQNTLDFLDFSLNPDETLAFQVPLSFPVPEKTQKTIQGDVFLVFRGETVPITPALFSVSIKGPFFFPLWAFILLAGIGFLLLLLLFLRLILPTLRNSDSKKEKINQMDIKCISQGNREIIRSFTIGNFDSVYLFKSGFSLDFSLEKSPEAVARVIFSKGMLVFETIRQNELKSPTVYTGNVLGKELEFKLSGRHPVSITFKQE